MAGISGVHSTEGGSMFSDGPHHVMDKRLICDEPGYDDVMTWPHVSAIPEHADRLAVTSAVEAIGGRIATIQTAERSFKLDEGEVS